MAFYKVISCDICGLKVYWRHFLSYKLITEYARARGWVIGKEMKCPGCKKLPKGDV